MPGTEACLLENESTISSCCTSKSILVSVDAHTVVLRNFGERHVLYTKAVNNFAAWSSPLRLHPPKYYNTSKRRAKLNFTTLQNTAPIGSLNLAATSISLR